VSDAAKRNRGNRSRGKQRERDAIPIVEALTGEPAKRTGRDQNGEEGDVQALTSVWEVKSHRRQPQGWVGDAEDQLQKAARNTGLEAGGVLHAYNPGRGQPVRWFLVKEVTLAPEQE